MSSVDFKKCKGGTAQASAMIRHMERHDGNDVEYANRWVDKTRTHLNSVIDESGTVEDGKVPRARQTHQRLKERVRQIDAREPPKRIRKDRVTVVTLTIAAPEGLADEDEERFFQLAYEEIAAFCGGTENVSKGFVHRDEIHDYIDTDGSRQTSRAHMHMAVIPYVKGKGVNGKAFETRARMRELNAAIDARCREELHVPFLTGKKGRTGRTVEELQAMSEEKAVLARQQELQEQIAAQEDELKTLQGKVLTAKEVQEIEIRKPLFGRDGETKVQYSTLKALQATAAKVDEADRKLASAEAAFAAAVQIAGDLEKTKTALAQKKLELAYAEKKAAKVKADAEREAAEIKADAERKAASFLKKSQTEAYLSALADKKMQELIDARRAEADAEAKKIIEKARKSAKEEHDKILKEAKSSARDIAEQAELWSKHVPAFRGYQKLQTALLTDPQFREDFEKAEAEHKSRMEMGWQERDRGHSR